MHETESDSKIYARPEVGVLASLDNEEEIMSRLARLAERFGNVVGISRLPAMIMADKDASSYLIAFEMTHEALAAARELHCYLVGFTTVMVSIPRSAQYLSPRHAQYAGQP